MVDDETFAEFTTLLTATNKEKPKATDLAKVRALLEIFPDLVNVAGNMATQVKIQVVASALGIQHGAAMSVEAYFEQMRDKLGYQTANPLERQLIEHVCICALRLQFCELSYNKGSGGSSFVQADYWERKLSMTQRRYLRAVETLVKVRKLNFTLQINIADKQIVTG